MFTSFAEHDFWNLVRGRRSVRIAERPVPGELVWQLLEAARLGSLRRIIASLGALCSSSNQIHGAAWPRPWPGSGRLICWPMAQTRNWWGRRAAISIQRVGGAPVLILPCLDWQCWTSTPIRSASSVSGRWAYSRWRWLAKTCCWRRINSGWLGAGCVRRFMFPLVQRVLELPESWQPQAALTLGFPALNGQVKKTREPLEAFVIRRRRVLC